MKYLLLGTYDKILTMRYNAINEEIAIKGNNTKTGAELANSIENPVIVGGKIRYIP